MDYKNIKETYPKTVQAMEEYVMNQHKAVLDKMIKEHPELESEMSNFLTADTVKEMLGMSVEYSPVSLLEFFDTVGIKIAILPHPEDEALWVHYSSVNKASKTAPSRVKAVEESILDAFNTYENKEV